MTRTLSWGLLAGACALSILLSAPAHSASTTQPATSPTTMASTTRPADDPEVKQLWQDAVSAFAVGQDDKALRLLNQLLIMNPDSVDFHLLDARALALQNKWKDAGVQAQWVLDHAHQDYQKEWASLVRAQAAGKTGDNATARTILKDLCANANSAAVKTTAAQLIDQLEP